jgi:coenzyme F420 biosynthesis associated uncharacterized protein
VSRERLLVDWGIAERVSHTMIGGLGPIGAEAPMPDWPREPELREICTEALAIAEAYAGLGSVADPPEPELIDRRAWAVNALTTLADASAPLERRIAKDVGLPGPLGSVARGAIGATAGAEAGVALGYAARRVIGQYDVALFGPERPGRLLFVKENMAAALRDLGADPGLFARWIAVHECTHVVQLERVEWLRPYLRRLATELIEGATSGIDARALRELGRGLIASPREFVRSALRGELARTLAGSEQRARLDRLQATMSVIEGHAEHVMDAAGGGLGTGVDELRDRLDRRRADRGGLSAVLRRLLGIDLKLRQYALGKSFCDAVVARGGPEALRVAWRSAGDLPSLAELERPERWLDRVGAPDPQAA